jgi:hypothetical protein
MFACNSAQQSRLANAITADQADATSRRELNRSPVEKRAACNAQGELINCDHGPLFLSKAACNASALAAPRPRGS